MRLTTSRSKFTCLKSCHIIKAVIKALCSVCFTLCIIFFVSLESASSDQLGLSLSLLFPVSQASQVLSSLGL